MTPLLDQETLDVLGLEKVVRRLLDGGVQGLFILGTTGEGPSLSYPLRQDLIKETLRIAAGQVPVLVGITDSSMTESLRMADYAATRGASAVVFAPPFYHPIDQTDLLRYLETMAPRLPLPFLLYNIPSHTKTEWGLETLDRALSIPGCVGLKDSSGNLDYFKAAADLVRRHENVSLLIGPEELLPEALQLGAHGGVCGGAHLLPRLFTRIMEAHRAGDHAWMATARGRLADLGRIYHEVRPNSFLKSMKAALSVLGFSRNVFAEPLHPFDEAETAKVGRLLAETGIDETTLE